MQSTWGMNTVHLLQAVLLTTTVALPACGLTGNLMLGTYIELTAPFGASGAEAKADLVAEFQFQDCSPFGARDCPAETLTPAKGALVRGGARGHLSPLTWDTTCPDRGCWTGEASGYASAYDFEATMDDETVATALETRSWPETSIVFHGSGVDTTATLTWSGWTSQGFVRASVQNERGFESWASAAGLSAPGSIEVPSSAFAEPVAYEVRLNFQQFDTDVDDTTTGTGTRITFVAPIDIVR